MNFRTTLVLAVLVVAGAITWLVVGGIRSVGTSSETQNVLERELTLEKITRIEVKHGDQVVVLQKNGEEWSLPGKWPVRRPEVLELVDTLTSLRSRFVPITLDNPPNLKDFGLDAQALVVTVHAGGQDYKLTFGEKPDRTNRFSWPTYVRLGDSPEVVRLAPGLVAALDRPQEHYMQRRLFPTERVAKEGDAPEKVEQLAARALTVKLENATYTLARSNGDWEMREPVHDRPDPDKLKAILTAAPDIWAERFVDKRGKELADFELKEPAQTLRVTRSNGDTVTLLVGKQSSMKVRPVQKPGMPDGSPFPPKPRIEMVHEEYKFAKLEDNDQVFEIKADRLKDLAVAADTLRDAQLARFKTDEVKRVEIDEGGRQIVLVKDKERWRQEKPATVDAETSKVTELLDKLSGLQAREKDVIDKADPKTYGLDKPASVKITVEAKASPGQAAEGDAQPAKTRELTFVIGKHDTEKDKLYVQVAGWPRVNAVDADLLKLVQRPALAYRSRRVLDFATGDLARIEVQPSKGDAFTLEQAKGTWHLATPVRADIESFKADQLAGDLGRLEVAEFVTADPKKEDLEKVYGLEKPSTTVKVVFTDAKKTPQTLLIGKQREGKQEAYARLASDPAIFVLGKDTRETLDKDSLAYRPLEVWRVQPEDIAALRVRKEEPEYRLERAGEAWKISGPFAASAAPDLVKPMIDELATLKVERYEAHTAKDLAKYGLDKPYLRVAVQSAAKKEGTDKKESADKDDAKKHDKEHVLLVGKPVDKDGKGRYARLGDSEAILVVGEKVVTAADHRALDLLERKLLSLEPATIRSIRTTGKNSKFNLQEDKKEWRVTDSPAPPFAADKEAVDAVLRAWSGLRALKFVAYGDKIDAASFGLDAPVATVTVAVQGPAAQDKPAPMVEHTLVLGKATEGGSYARLDKGPGVVVLDNATVQTLNQSYLDFVNHTVLKLDAGKMVGLQRRTDGDTLELARRADKWQLVKPVDVLADEPTLDQLVSQLANLHAVKVVAYPAKDLQPFGLEKPAALVTIRVTDDKGKPGEHILQIGKVADASSGERYARADKSDVVVVLPGSLAKQLMGGPLQFRDRTIARLAAADKVTVERGARKATFTHVDGTWKMSEPIAAEAEQSDLEAFLKSLNPLRADELVADKTGDLKPYGLERPQARWRFLQGDKEVLSLLVGAMDKSKQGKDGRAYAQLATGNLVFLLETDLTRHALGEYRTRKVWNPSAPDAAQVEKLVYGYINSPFILQKVDNNWQVAGKPGVKVNADAVRDALTALADLKAERYVVDKGADLKLYGLQPPALVLEIDTPSSPRTLHIGRPEGDSKRYYATVPGAEGGPVFVIGEADAGRIVRALQGFINK
jgi:hypothetical protein